MRILINKQNNDKLKLNYFFASIGNYTTFIYADKRTETIILTFAHYK